MCYSSLRSIVVNLKIGSKLSVLVFILLIDFIGIFKVASSQNASFNDESVANGLKVSECTRGNIPTSDLDLPTLETIRRMGYPAEEHVVVTDDGYITALHRIPGSKNSTPVFLQHGLLSSSYDWIGNGKENSLGFLLADRGYDVWFGNARGNTYSKCHTKYTTSDTEFWDFSFHEVGTYDLPAAISYVTDKTGKKIIYIGMSMGTTVGYVMATERPDIASKLKVMFSLAPVAYIDHLTSILVKLAPFNSNFERLIKNFGSFEYLSQSGILTKVLRNFCLNQGRKFCIDLFFRLFGPDEQQLNQKILPTILHHFPAGSSAKVLVHYFQEFNSGYFRQYDYGIAENLKRYNSPEPPNYDISKIKIPVGLFWSTNDYLSNATDVKRLSSQLPNKILDHRVEYPYFNHMDYLYALNVYEVVYKKLLSIVENYR